VADCATVGGEAQVVVGIAIIAGDRLLAAQRSGPPALAGFWELPGGKVDAGESDEAALVRECREELGVDVMLGTRVGRDWPIGEHGILRVWLGAIVTGEPQALEHAALRWLRVDELHDVAWLPADLPIVERLAEVLLDRQHADAEVALPGSASSSCAHPRCSRGSTSPEAGSNNHAEASRPDR
jgi:8-oxo-dGTP diphosphatase